MKEQASTFQEQARRSTSEAPTYTHFNQKQRFAAKFLVADSQLEVEVICLRNFKYYFRALPINYSKQKSVEDKEQGYIEADVLIESSRTNFQDVHFQNRTLILTYCAENKRFRKHKQIEFPPSTQLQLQPTLITEFRSAEMKQVQVILLNHKMRELQKEKKILFKEYKRLQKSIIEEEREKQRVQERQEQRKSWLKIMTCRHLDRLRTVLRSAIQRLHSVKGDTYIFFIFLTILLAILWL